MNPVRHLRHCRGWTQEALARAAGTSQPTIAAYEAERKSPTVRTLSRLAAAAGCEVDVRVHRACTREERRSLALHEAIAERLGRDPDGVRARARAVLATMQRLHPNAALVLDEWAVLLRRPVDALRLVLTDRSEWARELRHVTPFAGVLSAAERTAVLRGFQQAERDRAAAARVHRDHFAEDAA
jgi:transcriptional regulator with XRE-family HTH domain